MTNYKSAPVGAFVSWGGLYMAVLIMCIATVLYPIVRTEYVRMFEFFHGRAPEYWMEHLFLFFAFGMLTGVGYCLELEVVAIALAHFSVPPLWFLLNLFFVVASPVGLSAAVAAAIIEFGLFSPVSRPAISGGRHK